MWATSKHDVYVMQNYSMMHWSSLLWSGNELLKVAGQIEPTQTITWPLSRVHISTMAMKENLVVAGSFDGELICKVGAVGMRCGPVDVLNLVS